MYKLYHFAEPVYKGGGKPSFSGVWKGGYRAGAHPASLAAKVGFPGILSSGMSFDDSVFNFVWEF